MLGFFAFVVSFTSDLFTGRSSSPSLLQALHQQDLHQQDHLQQPIKVDVSDHREWVEPMGAAPPFAGERIERGNWIVTCDSEPDKNHGCDKAVDDNENTYWLTNRTSSNYPNVITIDLGAARKINGMAVQPRQDGVVDGNIAEHEISVSDDGVTWAEPVSYGTWWYDKTEKYSGFETIEARYVRLVAFSDATDSSLTAIAELNIFTNPGFSNAPFDGKIGIWGPTIDTPLVPVTAFVDPLSRQVVLISSKRHDNFAQDRPDFTLTAIWDPVEHKLSQAKVEHTHHNMFCPGTTFDADGRMIVSGGASGTTTSIYNGSAKGTDQWISAADLIYTRGYHSAVLGADGRMFVLGGSWGHLALKDPEQRIKNGEIYDPKKNSWTLLPKTLVQKMFTKDRQYYRRDNHGMLFTWKNDSVFQAGPSKAMNWYSVTGEGGWAPAGDRPSTQGDIMCGQAVMFDATEGKILVFGGSADYFGKGRSMAETFLITLDEPNTKVEAKPVEPMAWERTYAQAVVVPNGDVLVTGGQHDIPVVFNDKNPVLEAEIYSAKTGHWTQLANNSVVRVYHSFTLLLPDARVLAGGGGLCGDLCEVNHFDMQIYTPPYLLKADGTEAQRPVIMKLSTTEVKPDGKISIETDMDIEEASLVRYSGTTHTVNNDQRRVPVKVSKTGSNKFDLHVPPHGYVVIPGYWMLFVMNKDGVPSVSENIKVLIE